VGVKIGVDLEDHLLTDPGDAHVAVRFGMDHELLEVVGHGLDEQVRRFGHVGIAAEHEGANCVSHGVLLNPGLRRVAPRPCKRRMPKEVSVIFDGGQKSVKSSSKI